jgi:hypothetical protein
MIKLGGYVITKNRQSWVQWSLMVSSAPSRRGITFSEHPHGDVNSDVWKATIGGLPRTRVFDLPGVRNDAYVVGTKYTTRKLK